MKAEIQEEESEPTQVGNPVFPVYEGEEMSIENYM